MLCTEYMTLRDNEFVFIRSLQIKQDYRILPAVWLGNSRRFSPLVITAVYAMMVPALEPREARSARDVFVDTAD